MGREISNYRDFSFWNSIPHVIVLVSRGADRILILRRCESPIAFIETLNSPSLRFGKWIVIIHIYDKTSQRAILFFSEFNRQSRLRVITGNEISAFFDLQKCENVYSKNAVFYFIINEKNNIVFNRSYF